MKQLFIHGDKEKLQTALLHNGKLVEYFTEQSDGSGYIGNIYKGRIINVLPGMQAAFVDIGMGKNAYLYIDDLLHPHLEKQPEQKPAIHDLVQPKQEIIVQVMKESMGGKGARVTTHFSLPGRSLVYMPEADYIGVSKKIESEAARNKLRLRGEQLRLPGEGIIMRTASAAESDESLHGDVTLLRERWHSILERASAITAPALLYQEEGLLQRVLRDIRIEDLTEIWIDDAIRYRDAVAIVERMYPVVKPRMKRFEQHRMKSLFDSFGVTEQINRAFQRRIGLESGGYLIWDKTEALTVIDINTGKFTGSIDLEDTVFRTNMEAAEEIALLLRIRDTGGIIVIDFIDMEDERNRQLVLSQLEEATRLDPMKCTVVGWTKLGLLEMTRKRARASLSPALTSE